MYPLIYLCGLIVGLIWLIPAVYPTHPIATTLVVSAVTALLVHQSIQWLSFKKALTLDQNSIASPSAESIENIQPLSESAWIAQACHDLRQPTMVSSLSISAAKAMTTHAPLLAHLDAALQASDELNRMIQNILDFSELVEDQPSIAMQTIGLNTVFEHLRIQFSESIQSDIGLRFRGRDDHVLGHAPWIMRVLQNLIANAIQHAGAQRILVTARRQRGLVHICVYDDGIGMTSSQIQGLLHPVSPRKTSSQNNHLSSTTENLERKNYGLGTFIALRYARSLGSELKLHSQLGRGARFSFALPAMDSLANAQNIDLQELRLQRAKKLNLHVLLLTDRHELITSLLPVLQALCVNVSLRGVSEFMDHGLSAGIDTRPVNVVVVEDQSHYLSATAVDLTYLLRSELGGKVNALWITDAINPHLSSGTLPPLTQLIHRPLLASSVLIALENTMEKP
jgi:signal transduction histidine kinase